MISRRSLLAAPAVLAGCASRRSRVAVPPLPGLAPVRVSPERVIRTVAGLRPYRPSGFVVRAEKLGEHLLVHNYGHGGAGITLSWGSAQMAVDLAKGTTGPECAVLGCGVMGLTTARILQRRGYRPAIYTKDVPPNTTSNIAGGLWSPVTVYDPGKATADFRAQLANAASLSHRAFQLLAGERYAVRWLPLYSLAHRPLRPIESRKTQPEPVDLTPGNNPFGVPHGRRSQTMLIEPSIYLDALHRDFLLNGGRVVIREFETREAVASLSERLVFNCTGLGSRALFGDEELTPVKGQLVFLVPQPEIGYCTVGPDDIYMFPRQDGILLGGSHEFGEWNLTPDPTTTERILRENAALFNSMRSGFR